ALCRTRRRKPHPLRRRSCRRRRGKRPAAAQIEPRRGPGMIVAGIVLAGGLARRMGGGDKGLLRLGDRPVLDWVVERLRPQVTALALNANGDAARFAAWGLPV